MGWTKSSIQVFRSTVQCLVLKNYSVRCPHTVRGYSLPLTERRVSTYAVMSIFKPALASRYFSIFLGERWWQWQPPQQLASTSSQQIGLPTHRTWLAMTKQELTLHANWKEISEILKDGFSKTAFVPFFSQISNTVQYNLHEIMPTDRHSKNIISV